MPKFFNFVLFQIGWFACVLGAAKGLPWLGTVTALVIVTGHLFLAKRPQTELILLLSAALLGFAFDSSLTALAWIAYPNGVLTPGTAPHWMVALWLLFASTLNVSLSWLKRYTLLAALFGALGGPLAYYGGSKLGALIFIEPIPALMALSLGWAVLTPLLVFIAKRFDGFTSPLDHDLGAEVKHA